MEERTCEPLEAKIHPQCGFCLCWFQRLRQGIPRNSLTTEQVRSKELEGSKEREGERECVRVRKRGPWMFAKGSRIEAMTQVFPFSLREKHMAEMDVFFTSKMTKCAWTLHTDVYFKYFVSSSMTMTWTRNELRQENLTESCTKTFPDPSTGMAMVWPSDTPFSNESERQTHSLED